MFDDKVYLKEYILNRISFISRINIDKLYYNRSSFDVILQDQIDHWILNLIKYTYGKNDNKVITFSTPETWWEHFKMRYRNKWWLRRYVKKHPIQLKEHKYDVSRNIFFPDWEFPEAFKDKLKIITYEMYPKYV